jgi:hypothetical protein
VVEGTPCPWRKEHISRDRFLAINQAMRYTDKDTVAEDRFHEVRQMIDAFNDHYEEEYIPSWISCLDESMVAWLNKWCPGFMIVIVPRKPHPRGNEYHSIADGDDGKPIMWRVKLQEGKDRPKKPDGDRLYSTAYDGYSKTAGLMVCMTKPIHGTGEVVTMESGFCVTAGILALHDKGVYGKSLIKKRGRYWPKDVPDDAIDEHFNDKELGYSETLMQVIDGKDFLVHCQKDDDEKSRAFQRFFSQYTMIFLGNSCDSSHQQTNSALQDLLMFRDMMHASDINNCEEVDEDLIDEFVTNAAWAIRSSYHTVLKATPEAIFGRDMMFIPLILTGKRLAAADKSLEITRSMWISTMLSDPRLLSSSH